MDETDPFTDPSSISTLPGDEPEVIEHQIAVNEDVKAPLSQVEGLNTPERELKLTGVKDVPVDDAIGLADVGSTTGVLTEDELPPTTQFISAPHVPSAPHSGVPATDHEAEGGNTEEPDTDHPPAVIENESKGDEPLGSGSSCSCQTFNPLNWPLLTQGDVIPEAVVEPETHSTEATADAAAQGTTTQEMTTAQHTPPQTERSLEPHVSRICKLAHNIGLYVYSASLKVRSRRISSRT